MDKFFSFLVMLTADKIIKAVSVASLLCYTSGLVYNLVFYEQFNIPILNYIELSESLLLYIPFLLGTLLYTVVAAPLLFLLCRYFIRQLTQKDGNPPSLKDIRANARWVIFGVAIGSALIILLNRQMGIDNTFVIKWWLPGGMFFLVEYFIIVYMHKHGEKNKWTLYLPLFFIAFFGHLIITGIDEVTAIKKGENRPVAIVEFSDQKTITTNDTVVYVGETNKFIFMYNRVSKSSVIYPRNTIQKIELQTPR